MNGENYEHITNCDSCEKMDLQTAREYLCGDCKKEIECTQMTQRWMLCLEDVAKMRGFLQEKEDEIEKLRDIIHVLKQEREEMSDKEIEDLKARTLYLDSLSELDIQVEIAWQIKRIADASGEKKPTPVVIFNSSAKETEIDDVIKALRNLEKRDFAHI